MATASDAVYHAMLDTYAGLFPAGSTLELRAGTRVVATIILPAEPWGEAGSPNPRCLDLRGGWVGTASYAGTVTVDNYRLSNGEYEDTGSVSGPDGGGEMQMDNPVLAKNQIVTVSEFCKEF